MFTTKMTTLCLGTALALGAFGAGAAGGGNIDDQGPTWRAQAPGTGGQQHALLSCAEDIDGDGKIGLTDLTDLLAAWGGCAVASSDGDEPALGTEPDPGEGAFEIGAAPSCEADLDGSGDVGFGDLMILLRAYGSTCDALSALDG